MTHWKTLNAVTGLGTAKYWDTQVKVLFEAKVTLNVLNYFNVEGHPAGLVAPFCSPKLPTVRNMNERETESTWMKILLYYYCHMDSIWKDILDQESW